MWAQCKLAQLFCHYSILDIHYVFRKMVMPFASDISIKWAEHWDKLALNALVCVCLVLEWFYSYTIKMTLAKHQQHINYVYHRLSVTNLIGVNRICRASMKIDCAKHAWLFLQCRRFSHKLFKCQVRFGSIKTILSAFRILSFLCSSCSGTSTSAFKIDIAWKNDWNPYCVPIQSVGQYPFDQIN